MLKLGALSFLLTSSLVYAATSCTPYSASACPLVYTSCCAYICGEAQVPFPVCQPTDGTGEFAQCNKCPRATSTKTSIPPTTLRTTSKPATITPTSTQRKSTTTSCSNYSAANGKCPTKYDPCCKYKCAHAQVPFDVCQPTIDTVFAQCTACPSTTSKPVTTTTPKPTTTSCSNYSAVSGKCPQKYDPCCKYKCAHAQVPFDVCQPTIDTYLAQCTECPETTSKPATTTSKPTKATTTTLSCSNYYR